MGIVILHYFQTVWAAGLGRNEVKIMKIRKNKLIAVVVALTMCFSVMPTAAHATQDVTESGTYPVSVTIENYSDFSVRIPKKITMTPPEGSYTVYADCSYFAEGDTLKIVPDSSFELTCDSGGTVTATISQDTQEITETGSHEITGTITTGSLSAGTWTGSFNFEIEVSNLISFTICYENSSADGWINEMRTYQAEKGMTGEQWVNSKYNSDGFRVKTSGLVTNPAGGPSSLYSDTVIQNGAIY